MLILRGEWSAAEVVLDEAVAVLPTRSGEGSDARARLAELRRRQGRTEEALALIAQAEHQPIAALSQAAIALERGDPTAAAEGAARHLRLLGGAKTERAAGLELLAEAHAAAGQAADAAEAAGELLTIAEAAGTEPLLGAARHAEGCASAAAGSYEEAREAFEDARQTLERLRRLLLLERLREEPSRRLPVGLAQRLVRSAEQTIRRGDRIRHLAP